MSKLKLLTALSTFGIIGSTLPLINYAQAVDKQVTYLNNPKLLDNFSLNSVFEHLVPPADAAQILAQAISVAHTVHYNHIDYNDNDVAQKVLEYYLSARGEGGLDKYKRFFTKQDVEKFIKLYTKGSRPLITNDINTAYLIYKIYAKRATEYYAATAKAILKIKSMDELNTDRSIKSVYFADYRDENTTSLEDFAYENALNTLIEISIAKPKLSFDKVRERALKSLVYQQRKLNNYSAKTPQTQFMGYGIAKAADTHSDFFLPEDSNAFYDSLTSSFYGIGVSIQQDETGVITFAKVIKEGPAARQKQLRDKDELEAVSQDGSRWVYVDDKELDDVVKMIKGPENTYVYLKVTSADGSSRVAKVKRGKVLRTSVTPTLETYTVGGSKYGVLAFGQFYDTLDDDVRKLIRQQPDLKGLIIDLRNNGGGSVEQLLGISDIFLPSFSTVFQTSNSNIQLNGSIKPARPSSGKYFKTKFNRPIMVMTNGISASASEIFASAIQDYERGIVIGSTTYGKGTVQAPYELPLSDSTFKLTFQKFFRITGSTTQYKGVTPDISLPRTVPTQIISEKTSINPLNYSIIKPTRYSKLKGFVTDSILAKLQNDKEAYIKNNPEYVNYVNNSTQMVEYLEDPSIKLNYTYRKTIEDNFNKYQLDSYNAWATANRKPTYKTIKDLQDAEAKGFDPYLDLTKKLLVNYVNYVGGK